MSSRQQRSLDPENQGWIRDYPAVEAMAAGFARSPMPTLLTDAQRPDNPIVFANDAFCALTGYGRDEVLGRNCRFLQGPETESAAISEIREAIHAARPLSIDILNFKKDRTPFWNALSISPMLGENGKPIYYFATQLDATERRRTLKKLSDDNVNLQRDFSETSDELHSALRLQADSVRANDVLLHELHHRVKNNLQIISAMISMGIRQAGDPAARAALASLNARVDAIGSVHRRLHQPSHIGALNIAELIEDLLPDATAAYADSDWQITTDLVPIFVDTATAAHLALLLNEILAKAFTGAYASATPRKLLVSSRNAGRQACITISTTTPLRPASGPPTALAGSDLISALLARMGAKLTTSPDGDFMTTTLLIDRLLQDTQR